MFDAEDLIPQMSTEISVFDAEDLIPQLSTEILMFDTGYLF